jgi:3'-5' exoribonuclease
MSIIHLSDLSPGDEGLFYALLESKRAGDPTRNQPHRCQFRDRRASRPAVIWAADPIRDEFDSWETGQVYRVRARLERSDRWGPQLKLAEVRPIGDDDRANGFDPRTIIPSSRFDPAERFDLLKKLVAENIENTAFRELVQSILDDHRADLERFPAAERIHHAFLGGFVEHVASVARVCRGLGHYYSQQYYDDREFPPISRDVLIAGAVLHDIGKLIELRHRAGVAEYTVAGRLVGHVVIGRDMVREAAARLRSRAENPLEVPEEYLLRLEHAILSHHGTREYGAPVEPMTPEALILHYVDELDAKLNAMIDAASRAAPDDMFSDKVYALDNRRVYLGPDRGTPSATTDDE